MTTLPYRRQSILMTSSAFRIYTVSFILFRIFLNVPQSQSPGIGPHLLYSSFQLHFISFLPHSGSTSSPFFLIPAPLHLLSSSFQLHFTSFLPHSSSSSSPFFLIPAPRYASLCICFLSEKSDGLLSLSL